MTATETPKPTPAPRASRVVGVRLSQPWETTAVTALPPGWANLYRDPDGALTVEPCPALLLQCSELRKRLVYATESGGELVAANDRDDYVTTTADWALALRRNGSSHGRF